MLTDKEVDYFRVFGYVVLRGLLPPEHVKRLQDAFDEQIANNPRVEEFRDNGSKNLSRYVESNDAFLELICHPGLMEAMRDLDGTEFIYSQGSMNLAMGETDWHCDYNPPHHDSRPVKAMYYLDEMRARDGAFYLIPGTHNPDFASEIVRRFGYYTETGGCRMDLDAREVPSVPVETSPGDVVIWHNLMWHYASERKDGKPRRLLQNQYYMDPKGDVVEEKWIAEYFNAGNWAAEKGHLYGESMMEKGGPVIERMASRLEDLGVANVRK